MSTDTRMVQAPARALQALQTLTKRYGIVFVLLVMCTIGAIASPVFLTFQNLTNIVRQNSVVMIIACGITMIIISGHTDLSAGAVCTFGGCVGVDIFLKTGSVVVTFLAAVAVGVACGAVNGILATKFHLPAFIATLAMQIAAKGAVLLYTGGKPIYNIGTIGQFGKGYTPILIMFAFVVVTWVLLSKTRYGRYVYAIGGNEEVAMASGIRTQRIRMVTYMLCSGFTAFAGVLLMGRLNCGSPIAADGFEFEAIIGTIVGGTSFSGGIGNIWGTVVGCLIMGVINNILNLLGVQSYIHQIIKGCLIAAAVIYDLNMRNRKRR